MRRRLLALLLLGTVLAVYWPVTRSEFIDYDDVGYVTANAVVRRGLSLAGVAWAFTTVHMSNWHPLTWLSHMGDVELFGLRAGGHHATSLLLHLANVGLLLAALRSLTGAFWRSALVASLFAVHPLHVESVAWVAERKDVLSACCWLASLLAYARYARRPGPARWLAVAGLFAAGLLAKPMVVTLPFVLLLLDYWPLGRMRFGPGANVLGRLLLEKLPLFLLSAGISAATLHAQRAGGALQSLDALPLGIRAANALSGYLWYVGRLLWPVDLAVFYPLPAAIPGWRTALTLAALAGVTLATLLLARRRPYLAVGWLWYVGTLVPVIGLVQVGGQATADRYAYLPLIGLYAAIAWGLGEAAAARGGASARALAAVAVAALLTLAVAARVQVGHWRDSFTLFGHAIAINDRNWVALNNLGAAAERAGRLEEAAAAYRRVLVALPGHATSRVGLGMVYEKMGRPEDALREYQAAVAVDPRHAEAHRQQGKVLRDLGRYEEALRSLSAAVGIRPEYAEAYNSLGLVYDRLGRLEDAEANYRRAARLRPDYVEAHYNLGLASARLNRLSEAVASYRAAIELDPAYAPARYALGYVHLLMKDGDSARREYEALKALDGEAAERLRRIDPTLDASAGRPR